MEHEKVKFTPEVQKAIAHNIGLIVGGEPGFIMIGNFKDGTINTTFITTGIQNGDLSIAAIMALAKPLMQSQQNKSK